jgi:sulfonate transport system substrate-binding protein
MRQRPWCIHPAKMALNMAVKNGTPFLMNSTVARLSAAILCLSAALSLTQCSKTGNAPPPSDKLTIAIAATTDAVLAQVAEAKGFYHEEGLSVTSHVQPYGKPALQEVISGTADIATVAETPVMFAIMKGEELTILATIQTSSVDNVIIARKDRGIASPGDLKGKRIAVTAGTTSHYFLDSFLAVNGITQKDATVIDVTGESMMKALTEGKVDAVSTFIPFSFQMEKELGDRVGTFSDPNIYTFTFNVVATRDFVSKNSEKVKKVLRALVKAEDFVKKNPREAQQIIADFLKMSDMSEIRNLWPVTSFEVSLDQSLLLSLEEESRWAIKTGLTDSPKVHNYLDHIYLDGLKEVKPKGVRIVR